MWASYCQRTIVSYHNTQFEHYIALHNRKLANIIRKEKNLTCLMDERDATDIHAMIASYTDPWQ